MTDRQEPAWPLATLRWLLDALLAVIAGFGVSWALAELCMSLGPTQYDPDGSGVVWWFVTGTVPILVGGAVVLGVHRMLTRRRHGTGGSRGS